MAGLLSPWIRKHLISFCICLFDFLKNTVHDWDSLRRFCRHKIYCEPYPNAYIVRWRAIPGQNIGDVRQPLLYGYYLCFYFDGKTKEKRKEKKRLLWYDSHLLSKDRKATLLDLRPQAAQQPATFWQDFSSIEECFTYPRASIRIRAWLPLCRGKESMGCCSNPEENQHKHWVQEFQNYSKQSIVFWTF